MHKTKERERAASPGPTYMSPQQMTSFLNNLRTNRPSRPSGSRPPPAHFNTWSHRTASKVIETPVIAPLSTQGGADAYVGPEALPQGQSETRSHQRTTSNMSIGEVLAGTAGRALVQPPDGRDFSAASGERTASMQYRESGRRQVEREEAREVRRAMEELDVKEEMNLYNSARDEAAELVWKHQNPNVPGATADAPYRYPSGLSAKNSQQRSRSVNRVEQDLQRSHSKLRKRHSMGSSASGSRSSSVENGRVASGSSVTTTSDIKSSTTEGNPVENVSHGTSKAPIMAQRRNSNSKRKVSGSLFRNPKDQIYEEPEEDAAPPAVAGPSPLAKLPLQIRRNPFSRVQFARDNNPIRSHTDPVMASTRFNRYEIQKNPPSQSRNAEYTLNAKLPSKEEGKSDTENESQLKMKDGKEVRSDDIRAATGFRLKDRSAKLPTPTVVSDSPGRPIVSFQTDWMPKEIELKQEITSLQQTESKPTAQRAQPLRPLSKAATAPVVPTISVPDDLPRTISAQSPAPVPQINIFPSPAAPSTRVGRGKAPEISVYEDPPTRPLPISMPSTKVKAPSQNTPPPIPTMNVFQASPPRTKPSSAPIIPTISVQDTPKIFVNSAGQIPRTKTPPISVTAIPYISIEESSAPKVKAPSISVTPSVPSIKLNGPPTSVRPLPTPGANAAKRLPHRNDASNRSHWTPTHVRSGALCSQCALPISGRIVSAAGSRFHPECFLCHHCGEHLECVAFYPEPDNKYAERIARVRARSRGENIEFLSTHPTHEDMLRLEEEDGDESMRFYCHLDFHEMFSPRCKSCKTPIEGEVIVACGAEWHAGHFFCAQCGDPFDSATPFVEKDGYAWCVGCHTNRYSTKCRKCRKPVVDTVVKALGSEWHTGCFCCVECSGPFEDGRYFLRGESEDPVCVKCEERRLKA